MILLLCAVNETNARNYLRHAAKYDRLAIKENYEGRDEMNNNKKKLLYGESD